MRKIIYTRVITFWLAKKICHIWPGCKWGSTFVTTEDVICLVLKYMYVSGAMKVFFCWNSTISDFLRAHTHTPTNFLLTTYFLPHLFLNQVSGDIHTHTRPLFVKPFKRMKPGCSTTKGTYIHTSTSIPCMYQMYQEALIFLTTNSIRVWLI